MALSESPLVDATLMAIDEINAQNGVLGYQLVPHLEDGASNPDTFYTGAKALVDRDRVRHIFGCWTSLSRKAVVPIFEAANALLWYSVQYEGLEQSHNVFYGGSCLNQQIEPALRWLIAQGHRYFYLLGSDYVFPRTAHKVIYGRLKQWGTVVQADRLVPLGTQDFQAVIQEIQAHQPDVVFNTLNGDSNLAFYTQYAAAGLAETIPIMAVSVSEVELQQIAQAGAGHYLTWSYFQSIDSSVNQAFVRRFRQRYGCDRVTSDAIQTAYSQVYLWKQAVETAQSFEVDAVRSAAYGQQFESPGGLITIGENHHVSKPCRIGRALLDGQVEIMFDQETPIKPLPWLGLEEHDFEMAEVIIALLAEVPKGIQYSWDLEQKSRLLEQTLQQLQAEVKHRKNAEAALRVANQEIQALNQRLQAENVRMGAELDISRRLQQMILPTDEELSQITELEIAGFMEPAAEVGGDYYDVVQQGDRIKIGIGDVTGHGLESGVVMLMAQTAVRTLLANDETNSTRFLSALNRTLYDNTRRMQSWKNMTLALLDYEAGRIRLSGQHEEVLILRNSGTIDRIDTLELGFPLGLESDISDFVHEVEVELATGETVILYTDGITEAMNAQNEQYGLEQLYQCLRDHRNCSAAELRQAIIADLRQHIGEQKVFDDITLLVMRRK